MIQVSSDPLPEAGGVTLIDTGADKPKTRELWERVLAESLAGRNVSRLVCTHGHPDHIGGLIEGGKVVCQSATAGEF